MRTWLRFVRFPNTFSAAGDVVAGAAFAGAILGHSFDVTVVALVAVASMALYAFGIALNDRHDVAVDREKHPDRALPSGKIALRHVDVFLVLSSVSAVVVLFAIERDVAVVGCGIVGAVFAYDVVLKRRPLAAAMAMGSCRGFNLLLGMTAAGWSLHDMDSWLPGTAAPVAYAGLITTVTIVSSFEDRDPPRPPVLVALALALAYPLTAFCAGASVVGAVAAAALGGFVVMPAFAVNGHAIRVVLRAIFTLVVLQTILAAGAGNFIAAAFCLALYPASRLVARCVGQAGS